MTAALSMDETAYAACIRMADQADKATDDLSEAWAGLMAIAEVANYPKARDVATSIGHLIRLLVGLELTNGAEAITVPPTIAEAFAPLIAEIEAAGRAIPEYIPIPQPLDANDFAGGLRLGLQRAELLRRTSNRQGRKFRPRK